MGASMLMTKVNAFFALPDSAEKEQQRHRQVLVPNNRRQAKSKGTPER